jgi:hypothetical protein
LVCTQVQLSATILQHGIPFQQMFGDTTDPCGLVYGYVRVQTVRQCRRTESGRWLPHPIKLITRCNSVASGRRQGWSCAKDVLCSTSSKPVLSSNGGCRGLFPVKYSGRAMKLTAHQLVPMSRKCASMYPLPHTFSRRSAQLVKQAVASLVKALRYKPEDRGYDSRCHCIFQLT